MPLTTRALLVILLCSACGSDPGAGPDAGGTADSSGDCVPSDEGGESFALRVGWAESDDFVDMTDGQEVQLLWGNQGFLMILFDVAADMQVEGADDGICFQCASSLVSDAAAFTDANLDYMFYFSPIAGDLYSTQTILILADEPVKYDGAAARLRVQCDGHQRSGEAERTISLRVPPPPV